MTTVPQPGRTTATCDAASADLFLADVGISAAVYERVDLAHDPPFADRYWVELTR